jgi:hypothetical protein
LIPDDPALPALLVAQRSALNPKEGAHPLAGDIAVAAPSE